MLNNILLIGIEVDREMERRGLVVDTPLGNESAQVENQNQNQGNQPEGTDRSLDSRIREAAQILARMPEILKNGNASVTNSGPDNK